MIHNYLLVERLKKIIYPKVYILTLFLGLVSFTSFGQGATCGTAEPLPIGSCDLNTTISDSTLEAGTPNPSCAGNFNREGWYSFTVSGGPLNVTIVGIQNSASTRNLILQVLSGGCGSLTQVTGGCINATGIGEDETLVLNNLANGNYFLRVINSRNNAVMDMDSICITGVAPCNDPPSVDATTSIGATSATINWSAATPAPAGGYNYVVSADNNPAAPNVATGNTATTSANITGLTSNTQYYVFVQSACGSNWIGPDIFTTSVITVTNDECSNAVGLTVNADLNCGVMTAGSNVGATASPQGTTPGNEDGFPDDDVWFSFVAQNTEHVVSLENIANVSGNPPLGISIYDGGNTVDCNALIFENTSSTESINLSGLTINNIYLVRVYGLAPAPFSQQANFDVCVGTPVPPVNDDCSGATSVAVNADQSCTLVTPGTLNYATDSGISSGCTGDDDDDVWFTFVATGTTHSVSLLNNSSSTNLDFAVYANNPCSGPDTPLLCSTAINNSVSGLTAGNTYYIQVFSNGSNAEISNFDVCVGTPLANDDPCGAISLTPGVSCAANTYDATGSSPTIVSPDNLAGCGSHDGTENDVWFSTVVTATGALIIDALDIATTPDMDPVIAVYTGTCNGSLALLDCDDDSGPINALDAQITLTGLTPGTTLYIRVWDWNGGQDGEFEICVTEATDPCDSVIPITECGTTPINATIPSGSGIINDGCFGVPGQEVVYSFTPTRTGTYTITQISTYSTGGIDNHINYLYSTRCDASSWTCIDDLTTNGVTSDGFPMNAGTTYFIMLDTENSNGGNVSFTLNCPPPPPECGTTFYDSGGASNPYSDNEYQITTIYPDNAGEAVTATFTSFGMESCCDDFYVYDGPDDTYPLLGVFSGNSIPGPFTSTDASGALTFIFDSDGSVTGTGWAADITCNPIPPNCGETFYDSGDSIGNYGNNESSTYTISPDNPGDLVTVTFNSFNTDLGNDILLVYDGPDATGTLLDTLSGNLNGSLPGPYTSSDPSGTLTFVFTSNGNTTQSGWDADVTCDCGLSITETLNPPAADACNLNYAELEATSNSTGPTNIVWSDDFSSGISAWTATNFNTSNAAWISLNTTDAGGTANEAVLEWFTGFNNGEWILSSPAINIATYSNLQLDLRQYLNSFVPSSYPHSIFVETSLDNSNWTTQWSQDPVTGDIAASALSIDLSSLDGNTTMYIRFRFDGEIFGIFNWSIDNVVVSGTPPVTSPSITWTPATGLYTDAGLTTPYTLGTNSATVYAAPSGTVTYTATDQNGCFNSVTVTRNGKSWNGSVSTAWTNPNNWTPTGEPTLSDCVIIPNTARDPIIDGSNDSAQAGSLIVQNGGNLLVLAGGTITVQDDVTVDTGGTFELEGSPGSIINDGSDGNDTEFNSSLTANLIQINDVTNSGVITMERYAFVRSQDYVYWSSPVENHNTSSINGTQYIYEWIPTIFTNINTQFGNWTSAVGTPMESGKGYIVRGLPGTGNNTTAAWGSAQFTGVPHNGVIQPLIERGTFDTGTSNGNNNGDPGDEDADHEDDNWNLLGNPYPSNLSADAFLQENAEDNDRIRGTLYFWTHGIQIRRGNSPFFGDYTLSYDEADYDAYNYMGSPNTGLSGIVGSGQGFFVFMDDNYGTQSGTSTPAEQNLYQGTVTFNNNMRVGNDEEFFRQSNSPGRNSNIERHRIWFGLVQPSNDVSTLLVGYAQGATMERDRMFDAPFMTESNRKLYSIIENDDDRYVIQGRALPFDESDTIPLGIIIDQEGEYAINLEDVDGLFDMELSQNIYIEDLDLGIIHNIKESPYFFTTTEMGEFTDRFRIRFTTNSLGLDEFTSDAIISIIAPNSDYIKINSTTDVIDSVVVYDILGRNLMSFDKVNEQELIIENSSLSDGVLIVKVTLANGAQKIQKLVLKQ